MVSEDELNYRDPDWRSKSAFAMRLDRLYRDVQDFYVSSNKTLARAHRLETEIGTMHEEMWRTTMPDCGVSYEDWRCLRQLWRDSLSHEFTGRCKAYHAPEQSGPKRMRTSFDDFPCTDCDATMPDARGVPYLTDAHGVPCLTDAHGVPLTEAAPTTSKRGLNDGLASATAKRPR